jgi:predicted CXXCH cytochrome family protein
VGTRTAARSLVVLRSILVSSAVIAILATACSAQRRHSVLDTVFDGVPPYVTPEERARLEAEAAAMAEEQAAAAREVHDVLVRDPRFAHGPYAAKECASCHDLGAASGFRGPRGGGASSTAANLRLAEGGRLRVPVNELCLGCHSEYAADTAENEGLWLHGPVATGWCVVCHHPHNSRQPALLRAEPAARLCGVCHVREDLVAFTEEHRPVDPEQAFPPMPADVPEGPTDATDPVVRVVKDCGRCHDPHAGPDHFLLREREGWPLQASVPP